MKVYLLELGSYDDRSVVGVYATREALEAEILRRAYAGESLEAVHVSEYEVIGS